MNRSIALILTVLLLLVGGAAVVRAAQDDLDQLEEEAVRAAVERVAGSVVSIETVGGLERVGGLLTGTGPTTGLIVSDDGYIVSSAFNFAQRPTSILVGLPDGTRTPAELVARDHNRMIVLLKIAVEEKLPVPEVAPHSDLAAGQWAIAVGRAFDAVHPNVSVGIVSAVNRIWSKAIQTDAKISPGNYGGPLVDIRGRVMGVLVPLSPQGRQEVAGVEWYDSGIGFAVPLEQILAILPRLESEEDLYPGIMGISLQDRDIYAGKPVVAASRPNSPAYKAGIKADDLIVAVDGEAIGRTAELFHALNRRYAGDTIRVSIARGEEHLERELTLVDHLDPFQRPHLGILPLRDVGSAEAGVVVRYVYPESAAAKSGIETGDRIVTVDDEPLPGRDELIARLNAASVGEVLRLEVMRDEDRVPFELALGAEPEAVPAELPPPRMASSGPAAPVAVDVGDLSLKIAELANDCTAYVPTGYTADRSYGLVVWLHPPGEFDAQTMLNRWRPACEREGLILVAPQAATENRWQTTDLEFIRKIIEQVKSTYHVDDERVAAYGYQGGGTMAYLVAMSERELIHGVAAVDAPPTGAFAENDPVYRLAFYVTQATRSRFARSITAAVRQLRAMKYAVTTRNQGDLPRQPDDDEFAELLRWLDTLDKI